MLIHNGLDSVKNFKGQDWTDRLSRNICKDFTITRWATAQKSAILVFALRRGSSPQWPVYLSLAERHHHAMSAGRPAGQHCCLLLQPDGKSLQPLPSIVATMFLCCIILLTVCTPIKTLDTKACTTEGTHLAVYFAENTLSFSYHHHSSIDVWKCYPAILT